MSNDIASWGWDEGWGSTLRATLLAEPALAAAAAEGRLAPGRVIADSRGLFQVAAGPGIAWSPADGEAVGPDRRHAGGAGHRGLGGGGARTAAPTSGRCTRCCPSAEHCRASAPTDERHAAREHVLAANVDVLLMVFGLDGGRNFTERGLERLATIAWQSGATPVVVLNKADLAEDLAGAEARAREAAPGVEVVATSAVAEDGVAALTALLPPGRTAALTGRSGVGKSSIVNRLVGEEVLATGASRSDDLRGRHTTSSRRMIRLASGALLIDTPGLRTLGLWAGADALDDTFSDIAELATGCRFGDCAHRGEPGCAVQRPWPKARSTPGATRAGSRCSGSCGYLESRQDVRVQLAEKARMKALARRIREHYRDSGKRG